MVSVRAIRYFMLVSGLSVSVFSQVGPGIVS